jgi:uncharacterized repeat protein (TIGR01451 family)
LESRAIERDYAQRGVIEMKTPATILVILLLAATGSVIGGANPDYKVAVHVLPASGGQTCFNLPIITDCSDITTTFGGCSSIYVFPVFYGLTEVNGLEHGLTWPGAWGPCSYTHCADLAVGSIVSPGDGMAYAWMSCQYGYAKVPGWGMLNAYSPGQVSISPNPASGLIVTNDCSLLLDAPTAIFSAGACGMSGDDPCPPSFIPLNLTKSDNVASCANPGNAVVYTINYDNPNSSAVSSVAIVDQFPAEMTFFGATEPYIRAGNEVLWNIGDLAAGASGYVQLAAIIDSSVAPEAGLVNTCTIYCNETDETQVMETTYICMAPLSLDIVDDIDPCVNPGDYITYTITYDNPNVSSVSNVMMKDNPPLGTNFISATGGGTFDAGANEVTWNIGSLGGGAGGSVELVMEVDPLTRPGLDLVDTCSINCDEVHINTDYEITPFCSPRVFYVHQHPDTGDVSTIQAGINLAAREDTVLIGYGTYYEHDITLKPDVKLRGERGRYSTIIDAESLGRVFYIPWEGSFSMNYVEGLTLTGGYAPSGGGGAIYAHDPEIAIWVNACDFIANMAGVGGAIYSRRDVFVDECDFKSNMAASQGSAIYCNAVDIEGSTFWNNETGDAGTVFGKHACTVYGCSFAWNSGPVVHTNRWFGELDVEASIFAWNFGIAIEGSTMPTSEVRCCNIYGNEGGDFVGWLEPYYDPYYNFSEEPSFCNLEEGELGPVNFCSPDPPPICGPVGPARLWCSPEPALLEVSDVGNDQGGWVRIRWYAPCDPGSDDCAILFYTIKRLDGDTWTTIRTVYPVGESIYQELVPTLCDSTGDGLCLTAFLVGASYSGFNCGLPGGSDTLSGYSVDNLVPTAPSNPTMLSPTNLAWDANIEPDLAVYSVYGSPGAEFTIEASLIGHTGATTMDVSDFVYAFYHITATDSSGNESDASSLENTFAGVTPPQASEEMGILRSRPNPFTSDTHITFNLPSSGQVVLEVYDVNGKKVRALVNAVYPAGRHTAVWTGLDHVGNEVSPGTYFVRFQAGEYSETEKVTILR